MHTRRADNGRLQGENAGAVYNLSARMRWKRICLAVLLAGAVLVMAQQAPQNPQLSNPTTAPADAGPGRAWTVSGQVAIPMAQPSQQNWDAANKERRKQIADESAQLLKLATDLKVEVDKTTKDTLSLTVIRKADEIEKLAHDVKEKMRLSVGAH